ncbi:unnamed protein product, partial [Prorocentrum cordatum]
MDETPLYHKVRGHERITDAIIDAANETGETNIITAELGKAETEHRGQVVVYELKIGAVFRMPPQDGDAGPKHLHVIAELPYTLTSVDRKTAEIYAHIGKMQTAGIHDELGGLFQRFDRTSMSDGDGAIAKAERHLGRAEEISHRRCKIHLLQGAHEKSSGSVFDETLTEHYHMSKALQAPGGMRAFKNIFREVLSRRMEIKFGESPMLAADRRRAVIDEFLPRSAAELKVVKARLIVSMVANGDYDRMGTFEMYAPNADENPAERRHWALKYYVDAILALGVYPFPRSRWARAAESLRVIGLLANTRCLLQEIFPIYAARHLKTTVPDGVGDGLLAIADVGAHLCDAGDAQPFADACAVDARNMATHVKKGLVACKGDAFAARMLLLTILVKPQQHFMYSCLGLGSVRASERAHARNAALACGGVGTGACLPPRIEANLAVSLEKQFLDDLGDLLHLDHKWAALPVGGGRTWTSNLLAFRVIAIAGAVVTDEEVIGMLEGFPWKLYALAQLSVETGDASHMTNGLEATPACMLDPWTRGLIAHYSDKGGMGSADALADVLAHAAEAESENSRRLYRGGTASTIHSEFQRIALPRGRGKMLIKRSLIVNAVLSNTSHKIGRMIKAAAISDWDTRHQLLCQADCEALPRLGPPRARCFEAGLCLCGDGGGLVDMFVKHWEGAVKMQFPAKSTERNLLKSASFCQVLVGTYQLAGLDAHGGADSPDQVVTIEEWSCIAFQCLSPWKAVLMPATTPGSASDVRVTITMKPKWLRRHLYSKELLDMYGSDVQWSIQFFQFQPSAALKGAFAPAVQMAKRLDGDAVSFWSGEDDFGRLANFLHRRARRDREGGGPAADGDDDGGGGHRADGGDHRSDDELSGHGDVDLIDDAVMFDGDGREPGDEIVGDDFDAVGGLPTPEASDDEVAPDAGVGDAGPP